MADSGFESDVNRLQWWHLPLPSLFLLLHLHPVTMGAVNLIWLDSKETCDIHASGRPPSSLRAAVVGRSGRRTRDGLLILQRHEWGLKLVNLQSRLPICFHGLLIQRYRIGWQLEPCPLLGTSSPCSSSIHRSLTSPVRCFSFPLPGLVFFQAAASLAWAPVAPSRRRVFFCVAVGALWDRDPCSPGCPPSLYVWRMTLNFWSFCFHFPNSEITDWCLYLDFVQCWGLSPGLPTHEASTQPLARFPSA